MTRSFRFLSLISILLLFQNHHKSHCAAQQDRALLYPRQNAVWTIYQASFGNSIPKSATFDILRPPPLDAATARLCKWPETINSTSYTDTYHPRIGLLVPKSTVEGCTPGQQAKMAIEIQKKIPSVQFLIIHGTHFLDAGGVTLSLTEEEEAEGYDYSTMGVFYLPHNHYQSLFGFMTNVRKFKRDASWDLLDPKSDNWSFRVKIGGTVSIAVDPAMSAFYWLRFFLFTLLIVAPCFRAGYLWYSGGGRLHWRRNENGRITGILYVPPMPVWLWATRHPSPPPISDTLSEEQFKELPIFTFQKTLTKKYDEDLSSQGDDAPVGAFKGDVDLENQATLDTLDSSVSYEEDEEVGAHDPVEETNTAKDVADSEEVASVSSSEQPLQQPPQMQHCSTTCTMCSICIDDFQDGESLVLLPRCKHAFHKECIHPWLLERQGCCPLCKEKVMPEGETESESSVPSHDDRRRISTANNRPADEEEPSSSGSLQV